MMALITGTFDEKPRRLQMYRARSMPAYPLTFHSHVELMYVHDGQLTVSVDGQTATLHGGEMSVCFPYTLHQSEQTDGTVSVLLFDPAMCGGLLKALSANKPVSPFLRCAQVPGVVPALLDGLLRRTRVQNADDDVVTPAYLTALMGEVLERLTMTTLPLSELSLNRQILTYCMQNYRQDLSVESVAEALNIRKAQVTRTFLRLELNFRDYLNELRISAARRLLTQTAEPITDIIYESGFNNQGTFNRLFLKSCGVTPSEYRALYTGEPTGHHPA